MTPTLPRQAQPINEEHLHQPAQARRRVVRRRWLTAVIIVLLIGVPAGYLAVSAEQSRASGRDKARKAAADGLTEGWPSRVQRSIYEVSVPRWSSNVAYYETNNWRTSRLYVSFETIPSELDWFLQKIGTSRAALKPGEVSIGTRDQDVADWTFGPERTWVGITLDKPERRPTQHITVDTTDPQRPRVFVVSTATP
ncbi:hypothetical protein [Streptomyces sp. NPDC006879]|uniref:hypothetical protein n=1 Tax=Streptomyces sp. NPDC006879 TaxID=3364767 RepID=UPI0036D030F7